MTSFKLIKYWHVRRQMVKVQWADGWIKGGEATIRLTYCFPLKEDKSSLHKWGSLFWRPQSLLQLFSDSMKKPHTSRNILVLQEMPESSAYLIWSRGSQHCSLDVFLLSYRKCVSNFSSTWRCRFGLINALTTNSVFPTEAIFSLLCC